MKQLISSMVATLVFLLILLLSAGRLDYWQAWLYAAISALMNVCTRFALRRAPDVERERSKPGEGTKGWDKSLLGVGLLLNIVTFVVAGLDSGRYHFQPQIAFGWSVVGTVLSVSGMGLFLRALMENRFFSSVVRIQTDRGHTVCTTGPYRWVRHPGYVGMIIGTVGMPLLFTSAWSTVPVLLSVLVIVLRTRLEDRTLATELPGYEDYQRVTRYRLIPGLW
ncbi:MAG: isoprenylcysteine carboxylmethyltransferase family protein [Polyangiaceae bacterium]